MPDIRAAKLLRDAFHYTPWPCYFILRRSEHFRTALCQIISGERSYAGLLNAIRPLMPLLSLLAARGRRARGVQPS
jgi:hypothetical protein